jgi:hypothetical protein
MAQHIVGNTIDSTKLRMLPIGLSTIMDEDTRAGDVWSENGLIIASESGDPLDRLYVTTHNFKPLLEREGLPQTRFLYSPPT